MYGTKEDYLDKVLVVSQKKHLGKSTSRIWGFEPKCFKAILLRHRIYCD